MLKLQSLAAAALGCSLIFSGAALAQDEGEGTKEREKTPAAGQAIDVAALIAKAQKKFSSIEDLTCDVKQSLQIGGFPLTTNNDVKLKKGGKFLVEQKSMMGNITFVSDGTKAYMNMPQRNTYGELPAEQGQSAAVPILSMIMTMDKDSLEAAGMVASATEVSVDGTTYERLTLKVEAANATFDIDFVKDSGLLAKAVQTVKIDANNPNLKQLGPMAQQMAGQSIVITREYKNMKINTGLEDSIFAFTPPAGAQKFDPRRMGGMGGMPGLPGLGGKKKKTPEKKKDEEDF